MKKEEAIKIIEAVCEAYVGTKKEHVTIEQALITIKSDLERSCTCEKKVEELSSEQKDSK